VDEAYAQPCQGLLLYVFGVKMRAAGPTVVGVSVGHGIYINLFVDGMPCMGSFRESRSSALGFGSLYVSNHRCTWVCDLFAT
jgi:hypothetical protein